MKPTMIIENPFSYNHSHNPEIIENQLRFVAEFDIIKPADDKTCEFMTATLPSGFCYDHRNWFEALDGLVLVVSNYDGACSDKLSEIGFKPVGFPVHHDSPNLKCVSMFRLFTPDEVSCVMALAKKLRPKSGGSDLALYELLKNAARIYCNCPTTPPPLAAYA